MIVSFTGCSSPLRHSQTRPARLSHAVVQVTSIFRSINGRNVAYRPSNNSVAPLYICAAYHAEPTSSSDLPLVSIPRKLLATDRGRLKGRLNRFYAGAGTRRSPPFATAFANQNCLLPEARYSRIYTALRISKPHAKPVRSRGIEGHLA